MSRSYQEAVLIRLSRTNMARSDDEDYETLKGTGLLYTGDLNRIVPIRLGSYTQGADSFFCTFSRGLTALGETVSIQDLRRECKMFAENNPPPWFIESLENDNTFIQNSKTDDHIQQYINGIESNFEGKYIREGKILCQLHNTRLLMMYSHFGVYFILATLDGASDKYNNQIDLNYARNVCIAQEMILDRVFLQTISIEKPQANGNETPPSDMFNSLKGADLIENKKGSKKTMLIAGLEGLRDSITEGNLTKVKYIDKFLHDSNVLGKTLVAEVYDEVGWLTNNYFITLSVEHEQVDILQYLLHETDILYHVTKGNDADVEDAERYEALCHALCSDNFNMVEMLYDHWCSSIRRARSDNDQTVVDDLRRLGLVFNRANQHCVDNLFQNPEYIDQNLTKIYCLFEFILYQIKIYNELKKYKIVDDNISKSDKAERVRMLLLNILRIYEEQSDINNTYMGKFIQKEEGELGAADVNSEYFWISLYNKFEVYFRKLDFNVSLLLLDNLHILKQRLVLPEQTYQKLECALYYYIYRVSEDWRMYMYANSNVQTTDEVKPFKELQTLFSRPVIFFERKYFQKCLSEFREVLQRINTQDNVREDKLPHDEINCLTLLPYMRDDYSLKRIVHYMEALMSVDMKQDKLVGMLIIKRVLQVIGEMFKTSEESLHLSTTTKALLQTTVSVETLRKLEAIRTKLSHSKGGMLTNRMQLENTESALFEKILSDLATIVKRIKSVSLIYKPVLDQSLVTKGISLLDGRLAELPESAKGHIGDVNTLFKSFGIFGYEMFKYTEKRFLEEKWCPLGFTEQLLMEIGFITVNVQRLRTTQIVIIQNMMCVALGVLPKYLEVLRMKLDNIRKNNDLWKIIKTELPDIKDLSEYPTHKDLEKIENKLKRLKKKGQDVDNEFLKKINDTKDCHYQWQSIKEFLRYILKEMQIFNRPFKTRDDRCTAYFDDHHIGDSNPDDTAVTSVVTLIDMMDSEIELLLKEYTPDVTNETFEPCEFEGIDKMYELLSPKESDKKQTKEQVRMRRAQLFEWLIERVDILKRMLDLKDIPLSQHLLRYENDQKFRFAIEMVLTDIMSVLDDHNIKSPLMKSSNLLTEINLRHVLAHGNPFLEVIGEALDSREFPRELLTWATNMVADSDAIASLHRLFIENVPYESILNDFCDELKPEQKKWLQLFKSCCRWKDYLTLIPGFRKEPVAKVTNLLDSAAVDTHVTTVAGSSQSTAPP